MDNYYKKSLLKKYFLLWCIFAYQQRQFSQHRKLNAIRAIGNRTDNKCQGDCPQVNMCSICY